MLHGVLMEVLGLGVLLTGASGSGKGQLALGMVSRGHRLVADDAPQFTLVSPEQLIGACPAALCDFLHVRPLGVLNLSALFGPQAVAETTLLRLIIEIDCLEKSTLNSIDNPKPRPYPILGVEVPCVTLPTSPYDNLPLLCECLVRNYLLQLQGYNADHDFSMRQQQAMRSS